VNERQARISLLGPLEATVADRPMSVGGPGRRALLAALALNVGTPVDVCTLMVAIWDDRPPPTATTKLQGHVCALRQDFVRLAGPDAVHVLQTRPPGYVLCAHRVATDVARFDELVHEARHAPLPDGAAVRARALAEALRLWRGPACADVRSAWAAGVAAQLDERRWRASEDLAEARLVLGDHDSVIDAMQPVVREAPYRERAWEHLMAAHLGRGDLASALAEHERLRHLLATELGVAPGRRISRLVGQIRAGVVDSTSLADR
jgi:DNA-binding SARP family transcriptional activator